jgi:hypothetical protein
MHNLPHGPPVVGTTILRASEEIAGRIENNVAARGAAVSALLAEVVDRFLRPGSIAGGN